MTEDIFHFRRGGTSVVIDVNDFRLPRILHWGPDLGDLTSDDLVQVRAVSQPLIIDSSITYPQPVTVLPQLAEGWLGRPGLTGSRGGRGFAPLLVATTTTVQREPGTDRLVTYATDEHVELDAKIEIELTGSGILRTRTTITNTGSDTYRVDALEMALPVPDTATELLDLTGRWARERAPQRHPFNVGQWVREARGGKPGFDAPTILMAGTLNFRFRTGLVWGAHLGWSGNQVLAAERTPSGVQLLRGGEIYLADELVLEPNAAATSPWLYGSWGEGIDELSGRFHRFLRARDTHPQTPRPVLVNTWEAVYFDLSTARLIELAEASARVGAERFVVDDGWFSGRRNDHTSLGDWTVDINRLPEGLGPVANRVHELGMEFGLWFEPEMINLDSELARTHPGWIFDAGHGPGAPSRYQHVLNLGDDDAYALILHRMSVLIESLGIDYIKWDHNRFLADAGDSRTGRPGVRLQTQRVYQLMDDLKASFPNLEIESCASGGGRIDLGVLERTDRVWPSDCIDPHERLDIVRWTSILVPPELQGTHIGSEKSHTTARKHTMAFRSAVAFWGHLGIELDISRQDPEMLAEVEHWVRLHKTYRHLLHTGTLVHADLDPAFALEGVVSQGKDSAVYHFVVASRPASWPPPRLRLPGLHPDRLYRVLLLPGGPATSRFEEPAWVSGGAELTGRVLETVGLEALSLAPDTSILLYAEELNPADRPVSGAREMAS